MRAAAGQDRRVDNSGVDELRRFVLEALRADAYPTDHHHLRLFRCSECGLAPQAVTVKHHKRSQPRDFRGVIAAACEGCGGEATVFSYTALEPEPEREERLRCECGAGYFWLMIGDRIEGDDGLPGFFDEGVVAARCARCARQQIVVYYD